MIAEERLQNVTIYRSKTASLNDYGKVALRGNFK